MKYKLFLVFLTTLILLTINAPMSSAQPVILYGAAYAGRNGLATFYTIDILTGAATPVGPIGFERVSAMDSHPVTGVLYATGELADGSNTHVLMTIDLVTGAGTVVGPTGISGLGPGFDTMTDISFRNSDNQLYGYLEPGGGVGTIDILTGAATLLGLSGVIVIGNGIAFSPVDTLYHSNNVALNTLDQTTGAASMVAPMVFSPPADDMPRINAMDYHPVTGVLYASLNDGSVESPENYLATVDTVTGVVTIIGPTVDGLDAIAFSPSPPTPTPTPTPAVRPVGGVILPVSKAELLGPWIGLLSLFGAATVIVTVRKKRKS